MKTITPSKNGKDGILIRFSVSEHRYHLTVPSARYSNKTDLAAAQATATRISQDIQCGYFDPSLDRYRTLPKVAAKPKLKTLLELWDDWVATLDISAATLSNTYRMVRTQIARANSDIQATQWFTGYTLAAMPDDAKPDDLVFQTATGTHRCANSYRRCWKKVLAAKGIPYRKPYTTRHTCLSHAIAQGTALTGVAYLVGHKNTVMVIKHYGHMIHRPELPTMPIG
jgi:hypothetical protein